MCEPPSTVRLVRLAESPADYKMLGPFAVREIVYRLDDRRTTRSASADGCWPGSRGPNREALDLLRRDFDKPLPD